MKKISRILKNLVICSFILIVLIIEDGYPGEWEKVNSDGFGDIDNKSSFPMETFNNDLYVGIWNDAGTEIWMTPEGTKCDWNQVNVNGFGTPGNSHLTSMETFNEKLYVGVFNEEGGEIWLTSDGTSWDQVNIAGFSHHHSCVRVMSTFAPYGSNQHLYLGTDNEEGTQVWMTGDGIDWLLLENNGLVMKIIRRLIVWVYSAITFTWGQLTSRAGRRSGERKAVLLGLKPILMNLVIVAIKPPIPCVSLKIISM